MNWKTISELIRWQKKRQDTPDAARAKEVTMTSLLKLNISNETSGGEV